MTILIPAVHYADYLAVTLPAWRAMFPSARIVVLTSSDDAETVAVADRVGVEVVTTELWTADGAKFNKARALDEAMGFPGVGEVFVSIDADVYPCGPAFAEDDLAPGTIYGCARYLCESPADLTAHLSGQAPRTRLSLMGPKNNGKDYNRLRNLPHLVKETAAECLGFFQAFRWAGQRFGSYPTAARCDTNFAQQFAARVGLTDFYVLHLGMPDRRNWSGRVTPTWGGA
jgi:hypothetical protein